MLRDEVADAPRADCAQARYQRWRRASISASSSAKIATPAARATTFASNQPSSAGAVAGGSVSTYNATSSHSL